MIHPRDSITTRPAYPIAGVVVLGVTLVTLMGVTAPAAAQERSGPPVPPAQAVPPPVSQPIPESTSAPMPVVDPALATLDKLAAEAVALLPQVSSELARAFLTKADDLPLPPATTIWRDRARGTAYNAIEHAALSETEREGLVSREYPTDFYYYTGYGSPLVYVRLLDLASSHGLTSLEGKKVLDFGYGSIGQLSLMALLGAEVHGVDVEPVLRAMYASTHHAGAQSAVHTRSDDPTRVNAIGAVHTHHGRWPAEEELITRIGSGYDLITSKNTLKAGYIHPAREADPRTLVDLGVDDETFLARVRDALQPGGLFVIYNIGPKQNLPEEAPEKPYLPWADGWSPFSPEQFEAAGLEVLAFDVRDEPALHPIFLALGYDRGGGSKGLKEDVFVWYTVVRRR